MGEHGLMGKNMIYETAHHVPCLIRWPEKIRTGLSVDRVVASADFQQTLLGLVGLDPCGREQGRDASWMLRGEAGAWTDEAFIHHPSFQWSGIFTPEAAYAQHKTGYGMLYDRVNDPGELTNLYGDPGSGLSEGLDERVRAHLADCDAPQADWWT